jgi:hypothetical protein
MYIRTLDNFFGFDCSVWCQKRQKGDKPMKFTIEYEETTNANWITKHKYEFTYEEFGKRLASFLTLYEIHRTKEEHAMILARYELATKSQAIFLFKSNGFKFMVLPERR